MRPSNGSRALGLTFLALPLLIATSAQPAPPSSAPTCLHKPFRGITVTSEIGEIVGHPDPLDWGCTERQGGDAGSARTSGVPVPPPPSGVCFLPARPNPATTATQLQLSLGTATQVRVVIYGETSGHGRREVVPIRTLLDGELMAGLHSVTWDLRDDAGERVPAGVYRAVMEAGEEVLCGDIEVR